MGPWGRKCMGLPIVREATTTRPAKNRTINLMNVVRDNAAKRARGNAPTSELARYSGANYGEGITVDQLSELDVLGWWKEHQNEYPILSALARDLLSVQASSVASESVFSVSGRVLSMRRTKLTPESLEMCICLKDHLDAVDRIQDVSNLEDEIALERPIHDQEVEEGLSSGMSAEEEEEEEDVRL